MSEAMITRRGGGGKLNALVEQYKVAAGGSVSANGFVKFVDDLSTHSLQYNYPYVSACALDDSTVLVAGRSSSDRSIYCRRVTFAGDTVTIDVQTMISNTNYNSSSTTLMRFVRVNSTTAILFHAYDYSNKNNYWKYVVVKVADGAISTGGIKTLYNVWSAMPGNENAYTWDVIPIGEDKIIWIYIVGSSSNARICASIFTCNTTTNVITKDHGIDTYIGSSLAGITPLAVSRLSENKYSILKECTAGSTSVRSVRLLMITDTGSQIDVDTPSQELYALDTQTQNCYWAVDVMQINEDKLLYVYVKQAGTAYRGYMYGRVVTVQTTGTATAGTETQLSTHQFSVYKEGDQFTSSDYNYALRSGYGGIFKTKAGYQVIIKSNVSQPIYAIDVIVSADTITPTNEELVIAQDKKQNGIKLHCDIAQPSADRRIIYTTIDGVLTGTMLSTAIDAATSGTVDGVAKTSASAGETVDVYRPA